MLIRAGDRMNAELIAVGSELLLGQIANTNAQFISRSLAEIGVNVYYHTVVGDNPARLRKAIEVAESRANLIIYTGGLGPTKDDITKEVVSSYIGKTLMTDQKAMDNIEEYFKKVDRVMTENNRKQALIVSGAEVFPNHNGMAPGMAVSHGDILHVLLPGPPSEMKPMHQDYVIPFLTRLMDRVERIDSKVLRFFGIGESQLETEIEDLLEQQSNPTIAPLASEGEVTLRLTAKHESIEEADKLLKETEEKILSRVGEYFYGYDDTTIMYELINLLKENELTISAAESLTGGMFQEKMTDIQGAGLILKGGIVVYTNEAKKKLLNVKEATIDRYGVVSEQCAMEMADNIKEMLQSDIGISFTGVAGPDELEGHPVGTVYIGIAIDGRQTFAKKLNLGGMREANRVRSMKYGCHFLIRELRALYA